MLCAMKVSMAQHWSDAVPEVESARTPHFSMKQSEMLVGQCAQNQYCPELQVDA